MLSNLFRVRSVALLVAVSVDFAAFLNSTPFWLDIIFVPTFTFSHVADAIIQSELQ